MEEERRDDRPREPRRAGQPGQRRAELEAQPVGDPAAALAVGLDQALVLPDRKGQRPRALQEAPPGLQLDEVQIVEVDRDEAPEQDPAPPQTSRAAAGRREDCSSECMSALPYLPTILPSHICDIAKM